MRALAIATLSLLTALPISAQAPEIPPQTLEMCLKAPDFDEMLCKSDVVQEQLHTYCVRKVVEMIRYNTNSISAEGMCAVAYESDHAQMWKECLMSAQDHWDEYRVAFQTIKPELLENATSDQDIEQIQNTESIIQKRLLYLQDELKK